ncbi:MAG: hypothetical protein ACJ8GW_03810 [Massilia sp.]
MSNSYPSTQSLSDPEFQPSQPLPASPVSTSAPDLSGKPISDAVLASIKAQRETDPLIGARIGSKEICERMLHALQNERGVHIESMLCAAGALAGYACQAALRHEAAAQGLGDKDVFTIVEAGGATYYVSDHLNLPLADSAYSVWSLSAAAAKNIGCKTLPHLNALLAYVAETVGTPQFGLLRVPEAHRPSRTPLAFVQLMWHHFDPVVQRLCPDPMEWPILYSLVIQQVMEYAKTIIAPELALQIVMESAVSMSKVDLATARA